MLVNGIIVLTWESPKQNLLIVKRCPLLENYKFRVNKLGMIVWLYIVLAKIKEESVNNIFKYMNICKG